MSEDSNPSDSFDFDFDSLNSENPSEKTESGPFDLDNSFGDDQAMSNEVGVSTDNPYFHVESALNDPSGVDSMSDSAAEESSESEENEEAEIPPLAADPGKKKGIMGGLFGGKKKAAGEKQAKKIKLTKEKKEKKEKVVKEKKPLREWVPRDLETILCIVFSLFLLVSLLMFNIAAIMTSGKSLMQTICFLGAFNIIGLAAAAVPILFYKFPKERTLPNVMLGIAAIAVFISLQSAVIEFYRYNFIMTP